MPCDLFAAICGLLYFYLMVSPLRRHDDCRTFESPRPSLRSLRVLIPPGIWTFWSPLCAMPSISRCSVALKVSMGSEYATAFGVFNTIRWGLIMVPVLTPEQSTLALVGHTWGTWRAKVGLERRKASATWKDEFGKSLSSSSLGDASSRTSNIGQVITVLSALS